MSVVKEWSYLSYGQGVEDYANFIISKAQSLIRIFDIMEEDEDKSWLEVGRLLSQTIWEYGIQIENIIKSNLAEQND